MKCKKIAILSSITSETDIFKNLSEKQKKLGREIILKVCGVGKTAVAATTQKVISENKPDLIIFIGFAGSLNNEFKLNDLVIVPAAIDAEMDARAFNSSLLLGEFPITKQRIFKSDPRLVKLATTFPFSDNRIKKGFIATTSVFMDTKKKNIFIKKVLPLLEAEIDGEIKVPELIDMESSGFLSVTNANNVPSLVIRLVTNRTKSNVVDEYFSYIVSDSKIEGIYLVLISFIINNIDSVM